MASFSTIKHLALAGLIAEIAFELYAWLISPELFGLVLEPAKLVMALAKMFLDVDLPYAAAFTIHFLIGALGFSLTVYLVKSILQKSYLLAGFVAGVALWFVAQGMLAPLVGRSFMMDYGPYTQSSFIGHVGLTVIIALLWSALARRNVLHAEL